MYSFHKEHTFSVLGIYVQGVYFIIFLNMSTVRGFQLDAGFQCDKAGHLRGKKKWQFFIYIHTYVCTRPHIITHINNSCDFNFLSLRFYKLCFRFVCLVVTSENFLQSARSHSNPNIMSKAIVA
jgi:hypothetical protein